MTFESLLDKILSVNEYVRYATICDMKANANVVCSRIRDGVTNFLSDEKMAESLKYSVNWKFRNDNSEHLGEGKYVLAVYENVRRVTMPLDNKHVLLVTLDNKGGQSDIIEWIQTLLNRDYTRPIGAGPQY